VSRYLNRPLSTRLSMALAPLRLQPDLMSFVALLLGLLAAGFLAAGVGGAGGATAHAASVVTGSMGGGAPRIRSQYLDGKVASRWAVEAAGFLQSVFRR
jgi:hypothetical protein